MEREILYKKYIKGTNVYYGFDKYGIILVCKDYEIIEIGEFLKEYLFNRINLEDSRREYLPKERFEINILITEMMGINRVRKALRALSKIACTIDTSMDLLAADLLPVNKIKIHQMADEIRDKYVGYVEVV